MFFQDINSGDVSSEYTEREKDVEQQTDVISIYGVPVHNKV